MHELEEVRDRHVVFVVSKRCFNEDCELVIANCARQGYRVLQVLPKCLFIAPRGGNDKIVSMLEALVLSSNFPVSFGWVPSGTIFRRHVDSNRLSLLLHVST